MFLDYGFVSECCFAPIKMGRKKVKNTNLKMNIWICCQCDRKDIGIVKHTKKTPAIATIEEVDVDDEPVID